MKIVYKNEDKSIGIIIPSEEVLEKYSIEQVALKDVPTNLPYVIVEDSDIPNDRSNRELWELPNTITFDGVGSEYDTFEEIADDNH